MKRFTLMVALCLMSAVAQAKGTPFAVEPLQKAQALAKQDASKHLLIFYTHEQWGACRYITGELSGGELRALYSKDFVLFEADSPAMYSKDEYLGKLVTRSYTPVFVFLDGSGRKVLEMSGFRNPREAKALHEFITKRHYAKRTWPEFLAAYPK